MQQFEDSTFAEKFIAEKNFAEFYEQNILPDAQEYETLRKSLLKKFLIHSFVLFPLLIGVIIFFHELEFLTRFSNFLHVDFRAIVSIGLGILYLVNLPSLRFEADVKEKIFPKIFSFLGDFNYFPEGSNNIDPYKVFKILPNEVNSSTEDLVIGKYKDVVIMLEELELNGFSFNASLNNVRPKKEIIFQGTVVLFSMNKNFKGRTSIFYDRGKIRNFFESKSDKCKDLERVELEDPEFEKIFEVYGTNQIEARYLLTTSFMERLLEVTKLFKGSKVEAGFYRDFLFLAIPHQGKLFETSSIFRRPDYRTECETIIKQMGVFFSIIEILKLDQRTGL